MEERRYYLFWNYFIMKDYELKEIIKILYIIKNMEVWKKVLYCTLDYNIEFTKKSNLCDSWSKPSLIIIDDDVNNNLFL